MSTVNGGTSEDEGYFSSEKRREKCIVTETAMDLTVKRRFMVMKEKGVETRAEQKVRNGSWVA